MRVDSRDWAYPRAGDHSWGSLDRRLRVRERVQVGQGCTIRDWCVYFKALRESNLTAQVSSTLSQVPPIPPLSPNPTGGSGLSHQSSSGALALGYTTSQNGGTGTGMGGGAGGSALGTSAGSGSASGSSVLHPSRGALPRGSSTSPIMFPGRPGSSAASASMMGMSSASASASALTAHGEILRGGGVRSVKETLAHSSPSSPWSLLTIHALPVFAGSALKSSIEDLKWVLCCGVTQVGQS